MPLALGSVAALAGLDAAFQAGQNAMDAAAKLNSDAIVPGSPAPSLPMTPAQIIALGGAAFAAAALPVITLYIQTATVVPGQLTAGTFAGTGSGPTIGATTTPGLIL